MNPTDYIFTLINSFPCLRSKVKHLNVTEPHPLRPEEYTFDADRFHRSMAGWSSGERLCGLFILNVWNPGYARNCGWTFDVIEFMSVASQSNLEPVINWMLNPYWP